MPEPRRSRPKAPQPKRSSKPVLIPPGDAAAEPPSPEAAAVPGRFSDTAIAAALAGLLIVILLALRPLAGAPLNDDFSYARTAEALAGTGRIVYNGWGSPLILPQMVVGALIIKLFGFSYTALAWLGILCAGASAALMYLLSRACRLPVPHSLLSVAILTLNPMFLSLAPSFMTDVPSLSLYLGSLLALVRALESGAGPESKAGLNPRAFLASVLLGILAGSNRQILWVAYLAALGVGALYAPRQERLRRFAPAAAAVLGIAGVLTLWFGRQPYTIPAGYGEGLALMRQAPAVAFLFLYKFLNMQALFLLPFTLFGLKRGEPIRWLLMGALMFFCLAPMYLFSGPLLEEPYRLSVYGQYFTSSGALVGGVHGFERRPTVLGGNAVFALVFLGAVGMALGFYLFLDWWERNGPRVETAGVSLVAAGAAAQIVISLPWYARFDRYFVLLLPGFLILHAAQAAQAAQAAAEPGKVRRQIALAGTLTAALSLLGIAFAAEYFGYTQARATLYRRLITRGVPRTQIDAGFELNGDTQVAEQKYVNNPSLKNPPGAYREEARGAFVTYRPELYPAFDAYYLLSTDAPPDPSLALPEPVDSVTYASPLPPTRRTMYVYRLRRNGESP